MSSIFRRWVVVQSTALAGFVVLSGCASTDRLEIDLMPAPELVAAGVLDPLPVESPATILPYEGILYATDRAPDHVGDGRSAYLNRQGEVIRLGVARVNLSGDPISWDEARRLSVQRDRSMKHPLTVTGVEEFGPLDTSLTPFTSALVRAEAGDRARQEFVRMVDAKLEVSSLKDIIIYVHGYKVEFEDPILVASQFWHYMGYDGVFVAYSWPATPKRLAYFSDLETTQIAARSLRILIEFLESHTQVERVHIIGYSAGTRVVAGALAQLAALRCEADSHRPRIRLGHVFLAGSDMDRNVFGMNLVDGALDVVDRLTVYVSDTDRAMGLSRAAHSRPRLGESLDRNSLSEGTLDLLLELDRLELIDVTGSENATARNGHGYFRLSPWVSNDLLFALASDLVPADRALVRPAGEVVWTFPQDYPQQVDQAGLEWRRDQRESQSRGNGD